jgi:hypothetical protein
MWDLFLGVPVVFLLWGFRCGWFPGGSPLGVFPWKECRAGRGLGWPWSVLAKRWTCHGLSCTRSGLDTVPLHDQGSL